MIYMCDNNFNYQKFVIAMTEIRGGWTVDYHTTEAGPCKAPYTLVEISTEYTDDMTLGDCKKFTAEVFQVFTKYGFTVTPEHGSSIARPILNITVAQE